MGFAKHHDIPRRARRAPGLRAALLAASLAGLAVTGPAPSAWAQTVPVQAVDIAGIQRLLAELQYDVGPADGVMGPRTAAALTRFQIVHALTPTGDVDQATLATLNAEAARLARMDTYPLGAAEEGYAVAGAPAEQPLPAGAPGSLPPSSASDDLLRLYESDSADAGAPASDAGSRFYLDVDPIGPNTGPLTTSFGDMPSASTEDSTSLSIGLSEVGQYRYDLQQHGYTCCQVSLSPTSNLDLRTTAPGGR